MKDFQEKLIRTGWQAAFPGVYEVEGLPVTPYMVPQECGMHMNTKSVTVYRSKTLDNSSQKCEKVRSYVSFR